MSKDVAIEMFLKGVTPGIFLTNRQFNELQQGLDKSYVTRKTVEGVIVTVPEHADSVIGIALGYKPEDIEFFRKRLEYTKGKNSLVRVSKLVNYNGVKFRTKNIRKAIKWCEEMYGVETRKLFENPFIRRTIRVNISIFKINIGFSWDRECSISNKRKGGM